MSILAKAPIGPLAPTPSCQTAGRNQERRHITVLPVERIRTMKRQAEEDSLPVRSSEHAASGREDSWQLQRESAANRHIHA